MAGSTPENQGLHVDICLTDIHVSINTETIALINKCQATLLSDFSRDESTEVFADYSDLWSVKNFVDDDYWFLKTGRFHLHCSEFHDQVKQFIL